MHSRKFPVLALAALALLLSISTAGHAFLGFGNGSATVHLKDGAATLPTAGLEDGQARYYQATVHGATVRFFLVRDQAGAVHAAFDACDVCWREHEGYTQDGSHMVCNNCGQAFPVARIGTVQGGCNPAPLAFSATGANVTIKAADLAAGTAYFAS